MTKWEGVPQTYTASVMVTGRVSQRQRGGGCPLNAVREIVCIYSIEARVRIVGNGEAMSVYEREKPGRGGVLFALFAAGTPYKVSDLITD